MGKFSAVLDRRDIGSALDQIFSEVEDGISSEDLTEQVNTLVEPDYEKRDVTSALNELRDREYVTGYIEDGKFYWELQD